MEKLNKNVLFVAFVNGVLLQKYWRNTELICFKKVELSLKETFVFIGLT